MAEKPSTCPACGKRLSKKQWFYRNGQYFDKRRCFYTARDKAAQDSAKAKDEQAAKAKDEAAKAENAKHEPAPAKPEQAEAKQG